MKLAIDDNQIFLKKEKLSKYHYTLSLLKEGVRIGRIDRPTIGRIQAEIALIFKNLIIRYTKGESDSVRIETAENLLNSVYYSLDAYLSRLGNPEKSIALLKAKSIAEIYENGLNILTSNLVETQKLYREIRKKKLDLPLDAYNSTIEEALPVFFNKYSAIFNAQDTMCSIDYPLIFDDMKLQGIFYIQHYLKNFLTETEFCRLFHKEDIISLLENYGRTYRIDYRKALINIFEVIANNAVFTVISGKRGDRPNISPSQSGLLQKRFMGLRLSEINPLVEEAFAKVIANLRIEQSNLIDYLHRYRLIFIQRLLITIQNGGLDNLIISGTEATLPVGNVIFENSARMSDSDFRNLILRIRQSESVTDKVNLITSSIRSIEDFYDLLTADCLYGEEYVALFSSLSNMELAVLGRIAFPDESREELPHFLTCVVRKQKYETEWQTHFAEFIRNLSQERVETLERLIHQIDGSFFYHD